MASLSVRKLLKKLGLLESAQSIKKRFSYIEKPFAPCTPHALIAIHKGLRWCLENDLVEVGDYLEFGVFRGFTLWYAQELAREMGIQRMRFFGFDSFFGLPAVRGVDRGGEFQEGAYFCSRKEAESYLNQHRVDWKKTALVEGWFEKTLVPPTRERLGLKKCSLCLVDCDLYESTVSVLKFVGPLIHDRAIILLDDWNSFGSDPRRGEQAAFSEFLRENPHLSAEPFVEFGGHGKGFILRAGEAKSR